MKHGFKKIIAAAMATTMAFAMSASAFAVSEGYDNLTNTADTNYSFRTTTSEDAMFTVKVVPANDSYVPGAFTYEEASAGGLITWGLENGSNENNVFVEPAEPVAVDGGYAACATIYAFAGGEAGSSSVYAQRTDNNRKMNFTVVMDGVSDPANNVSYVFYNEPNKTTSEKLLTVKDMTVSGNDHYGQTEYPSALDGIYGAWLNTLGEEDKLTNYKIVNDYGSDMLKSLTFEKNGTLTNYTEKMDEAYNYIGWQYRVYRGGQRVALSEMVGAGEFRVQANDVVVWKYGPYGVVSFPDSYILAA